MSTTDVHVLDDGVEEFAAAHSGAEAVVTESVTLTADVHDFWGFGGTPGVVVRPGAREEVAAVVRIAADHHVPLVN